MVHTVKTNKNEHTTDKRKLFLILKILAAVIAAGALLAACLFADYSPGERFYVDMNQISQNSVHIADN